MALSAGVIRDLKEVTTKPFWLKRWHTADAISNLLYRYQDIKHSATLVQRALNGLPFEHGHAPLVAADGSSLVIIQHKHSVLKSGAKHSNQYPFYWVQSSSIPIPPKGFATNENTNWWQKRYDECLALYQARPDNDNKKRRLDESGGSASSETPQTKKHSCKKAVPTTPAPPSNSSETEETGRAVSPEVPVV